MAGYDWENGELDFLDVLNIASFIVGLINLELNEKQIDDLMKEMTEKQDILLQKAIDQSEIIIAQNKEIIKLLKENK